ncbi:MAG: SH3 domain-containing protein [Clostridia bacterium]|nr:SH3 domain-containing protein [Clostridia bacterium]
MTNRKKFLGLLFLCLLLLCVSVASAVEYPCYACCTGTKVNIRKSPEEMYPSRGQIVKRAPVTVLGEEGDCYRVSTDLGEGYIPKQYIKLFEGMTAEEFAEYKSEHPSQYRKKRRCEPWENDNAWLLWRYENGDITKEYLLEHWTCEPCTGYTGLYEDDKGKLHVFRRYWW